jgi:two-component system sensor histidine kinase TctE
MSGGLEAERLAILVHEVRSPVAALAAVAETAAEPSGDAAVRRELVRLALAACRAIERLVLDASAASVRLERLDASSLVRDVVAAHGVRGSSVAGQVDDDLVVDGDPVRLRQALDNVIANALGHGGGAEVSVRAESDEGTVCIAVSDAGHRGGSRRLAGRLVGSRRGGHLRHRAAGCGASTRDHRLELVAP